MVIFMCGLPKSGKTSLVEGLKLPKKVEIISPAMFEFDELKISDEYERKIVAWKMAVEFLSDRIKESSDDEIMLFDTCCANESMLDVFNLCKERNHRSLVVFVDSSVESCVSRSVDESLLDKYKDKFKRALPQFKDAVDAIRIVHNNEDLRKARLEFSKVVAKFILGRI